MRSECGLPILERFLFAQSSGNPPKIPNSCNFRCFILKKVKKYIKKELKKL